MYLIFILIGYKSKTNLAKSCYKSCWQEGFKFNTEFNSSNNINKVQIYITKYADII